tara:strand:+ start:337 stop:2265 length:1929 start_codon:yes stop_codon:yes gene_type:complete
VNWIFRERGEEKHRDPLGAEFFNNEELLSDASSLVREAIQNSLDAKADPDEPVRVRFRIGVQRDPTLIDRIFSGLEPHTEEVFGSDRGKIRQQCRYLVYEDFNTEGLKGDTRVASVPSGSNEKDHSYTFFVHYEGKGSKTEGSRGKWGVGKVVFPMISATNSFFAYSVRSQENALCGNTNPFIGMTILKFHSLGSVEYQPDGWFSDWQGNTPVPIGGEEASNLAGHWSVSRTDETGLSIIIPYIGVDLDMEELRDAVIRQYFLAILGKELVCTFVDEDDNELTLDHANLALFIRELGTLTKGTDRDLTARQVTNAIETWEAMDIDFEIQLATDTTSPATKHPIDEDVVREVRESLDSNGFAFIHVDLEVPIPRGKANGDESRVSTEFFEICITRDPGNENPIIYSREGILVPGRQKVMARGFTIILLPDEGSLSDLLGYSEGPAHEEWSKEGQHFQDVYGGRQRARAERVIDLVKWLPKRLEQELNRSEAEVSDSTFFAEWFQAPASLGPGTENKPARAKTITVPTDLPQSPALNVSMSNGTISIQKGAITLPKGSVILARFAYATSKGDPFRKWSVFDFSLTKKRDFKILVDGVKVVETRENELEIRVVSPDRWSLALNGFDSYRDLEVRTFMEKPKGGGN